MHLTPAAVASPLVAADLALVGDLVVRFFAALTSGPDLDRRLADLRAAMLPEAVIVRTVGGEPTVYDVASFIAPRREWLSREEVSDFAEQPAGGRVELFGDLAHWFGPYTKSWVEAGTAMTGAGMKSVQMVRTETGWRISAVAWDDVRAGLGHDAHGVADASSVPLLSPPAQ